MKGETWRVLEWRRRSGEWGVEIDKWRVRSVSSRTHCKHKAHSCVVGCKERGWGLTYDDSLINLGNNKNVLFVVQPSKHVTFLNITKFS